MKRMIFCQNCKAELGLLQRSLTCPHCSATAVEFQYQTENGVKVQIRDGEKGIWRYQDFLPSFDKKVSLGEGNTPLRKALHLFSNKLGLLLKIEGKNPTGSFLDRVSPLLVSDALSRNMNSLVCASDGNLGASLSAYCATAQIKCICVVPKSTSPEKRTQMIAHGAEIIDYGETIDSSLSLAQKMTEEGRYQATPEFNLLTVEGGKTISFEIIEQQQAAIPEAVRGNSTSAIPKAEYVVVPMGSGHLLYSIWKGFKEAKELGLLTNVRMPKIIGVQVKGYDPIITAFESGEELKVMKNEVRRGKGERMLADAILVRHPIFGARAIKSIKESNGIAVSVTEKEMVTASKKLGTKEGVFAELSSATVIAAIEKLLKERYFKQDAAVLAVITASGLKTSRAFQRSTTTKKRVESFRSMGTKVEILRIIDSAEANFGYSIWKALGQTISLQAVYQHLKELNRAEHITEIESDDRQKKYQLTEKGRKLIQKMRELEELLT